MSSTLDSTTRTADWSSIRAQLEEQRADCVQQREQALAECATSVPDPVALRRSADLQDTIEEIDAALARIDAGTYGSCTECGKAIPQERLEFRPMARSCVACS
ncbi:TraR/DksA C4-type zinc finger protein [Blastococcus sp. CCUG 61487]|uniref:TraR/DksA family transcriptional regulator n=1 Tax=Blastococcus sp. CCUG 61487 TaxID=1840703 RepID=UPI0010C059A0|nr:TraR/DksA C4-type zinc finger protein [Blastococcus sp. CCUG 61487]TKJ16811.1 conjugal transfer protein TraR [Blastococcus sp. CCUG 61487]